MAKFKIEETGYTRITHDNKRVKIVKKDFFDKFNEDILGLGNIKTKSVRVNALSVMFDLEGFTSFCNQIDPHLAVPEFLGEFLAWIFSEVRGETISKEFAEGYETYSDLPFLAKYVGDGVLFLWDTQDMHDITISNVVLTMYEVCKKYETKFLRQIAKKVTNPPAKLRCGIARGDIYSVGNGNDYVGPCINMSARLQKLHSVSFSFARRGIDPDQFDDVYKKNFIVKKVDIRGIGDNELVCIPKDEYVLLKKEDKEIFKKT